MSEPAAPVARKRATRVPGETAEPAAPVASEDETDTEAAAEEPVSESARHVLPDFRHKSAAYAQKWFKDNPNAPKRSVLTAEGFYVHPEAFKSRAEK